MAIYHVSAQIIGRSQGRSAVASAAYRAAEKLHDERTGLTHDYTKKAHDILYKEIMLPANANVQEWMKDREKLWNAVEATEERKDSQLAREFNIALPKELTPEQSIELAKDFVQKEFVDKGMIADLCLHKGHKGSEEQPHIHLMLTMREIVDEAEKGFGKKVRSWNSRDNLEKQREAWAEYANKYLALNGHDMRIDHRSYEEQGINLEPQYKIGPTAAKERLARFEDHQRIAKENGERIFTDPHIALDALTHQQSTFTHQDLAKLINRQTIDAEQFQRVYEKVKYSEEIVYLGKDDKNRERFTTKEMLELEKQMIETASELKDQGNHPIRETKETSVKVLQAKYPHLSNQQQNALEHMLKNNDLSCIIGYAGTGKSTILRAACEVWEQSGYRVHGATLSGIAAENLTGTSGIESRTVASRLYYWDRGRELLSKKDILVVDEAGMLGSRQMSKIVAEVARSGAKLILIGDPQQLQAIEAGAAFRAIIEQVHHIELTEVHRQIEPWQQEATKEFAQGKVSEGLEHYDQHDHLHEYETQSYAKQGIVEMWNDVRINNPEETQIMLAYTRNDVAELNDMARELRQANQELGEDCILNTASGKKKFARKDRIYFLKNERSLCIMNGTLGTIENITKDQVTVVLDKDLINSVNNQQNQISDRSITIDLNLYNHITHGYAATIHKAQGVTVDRTYLLASKYMDAHASYVALSRHRKSVDLFYGKDEFVNKRALRYNLGRDRSKDVSLDYGITPKELSQEQSSRSNPRSDDATLASIKEIQERYAKKLNIDCKKHMPSIAEIKKAYSPKRKTTTKYQEKDLEIHRYKSIDEMSKEEKDQMLATYTAYEALHKERERKEDERYQALAKLVSERSSTEHKENQSIRENKQLERQIERTRILERELER